MVASSNPGSAVPCKQPPLDRTRHLERFLVLAIVAVLACGTCGGCATAQSGSIWPTGQELEDGAKRWRKTARPEDQAVIDELIASHDLTIHLIVGNLAGFDTRGGASSLASDDFWNKTCFLHPKRDGVPPGRDWHVIYDPVARKEAEKRFGIAHPVEVILHHEIFGHILPALRDPRLIERVRNNPRLKKENERDAVEEENRYRRYLGLPELPPSPKHLRTP